MRKIALITGASKGIGASCAEKFAEGGYDVIITGRDAAALSELETRLKAAGKRGQTSSLDLPSGSRLGEAKAAGADVLSLAFDVRDREQCEQAVASLSGKWAAVDVLVNNAGLALGLAKEYEADMNDWDTIIDTNIKGLLYMTRLIVPKMVERDCGHVINIGSLAGDYAYAGGNVYCATKAAVKAVSDGLRIDVAHTSIRVTNIKPGLVETNFSVTRFYGDKAKADNVYKGIKPLTGKDIAEVCFFCAAAPAHVQIAEVLITATHQANSFVVHRE